MRNNEIHHLSSTLFVMENQYTVSVKTFGNITIFNGFYKVSPAHQGCIYLIQNTVKTVSNIVNLVRIKRFECILKCNLFL